MKTLQLLSNIIFTRTSRKIVATAALLMLTFSICTAQKWLWGQEGSGSIKADDYATPIATDKQGNAYVTGQFDGSITFGTFNLTTSNTDVPFLVKYNSAGSVKWAVNPTGLDDGLGFGLGVATDPSGNIFLTGLLNDDQLVFGNDTLDGRINNVVFLVKYDPNGNVLWAKQSNDTISNNSCFSYSVACDATGNSYITGSFKDSIQFGTFTLNAAGSNTVFLVKYDPDGNVLWAKQSTGPGDAEGEAVVTHKGCEYITGYADNDSVYFGTYSIVPTNSYNVFLAKYDTSGNVLWTQQSTGTVNANSPNDAGLAVTSDIFGDTYVGGVFGGSIQFDSKILTSPDSSAFLVKYNSSGNVLWAKASSNGSWLGTSLASDNANHIYYGGVGLMDTLQWGSSIFSTANSSSPSYASFIMMLDTAGNALCGSIHSDGAAVNENYYITTGIASDSAGIYIYQAGVFNDDSLYCGPDTLIAGFGGNSVYVARWNACNVEGINELKEKNEGLTVFPNPFHNSATIMLTTQNSITDTHYIEVEDITGRQLQWIEFSGAQYELSAAGIASGLYFIRAFDSEKNVIGTTKIVVQ